MVQSQGMQAGVVGGLSGPAYKIVRGQKAYSVDCACSLRKKAGSQFPPGSQEG